MVQLPRPQDLDAVHQSGGEYRAGVNEAEVLGVDLVPSDVVAPPRVADAPVAFECRLVQETAIGDPAAAVCFLEILRCHVADAVAAADGLPDPHKLVTLARLGERSYLQAEAWQVSDRDKQIVPEDLRR